MELADDMTRDMRRKLRRKLKEDLIRLHNLSSKLEARELQLQRLRLASAHPSISDAQFSVNDTTLRYASGKEVTSQLIMSSNGLGPHSSTLAKQQSFAGSNGIPVGAEILSKKRTSKTTDVYDKSRSIPGKSNLPLSSKPTVISQNQNKQESGKNQVNPGSDSFALLNKHMAQCKNILKKLMGHEDGWIFNEPVDAVKLGLSDYHSVIKRPMDLGTIKSKLDKKQYKSLSEFADDIVLTFNNAMTYNPQGNDVHQSAVLLLSTFQKDWEALKKRWEKNSEGKLNTDNGSNGSACHPEANFTMSRVDGFSGKAPVTSKSYAQAKSKASAGKAKSLLTEPKAPAETTKAPGKSEASKKAKTISKTEMMTKSGSLVKSKVAGKPKTMAKAKTLPKPKISGKPKVSGKTKAMNDPEIAQRKSMTYEEKVELQSTLGQLPQHMLEELILLMKERNINMSQEGDEIEIDLDSFNGETLWELDRKAKACLKQIRQEPQSQKRSIEDNQPEKAKKKQKVFSSAPGAVV